MDQILNFDYFSLLLEFVLTCKIRVLLKKKLRVKMEGLGRRISASPRPCSGRRVLAKKRVRSDGFVNSVKKLQRREICSKRDRAFSISNAQERFRNMHLVVLHSTKFSLFSTLLM